MTVFSHAQKHKIQYRYPVRRALGQMSQICGSEIRGHLGIMLSVNAVDLLWKQIQRMEEVCSGQTVVAFRILRWNTAFIGK